MILTPAAWNCIVFALSLAAVVLWMAYVEIRYQRHRAELWESEAKREARAYDRLFDSISRVHDDGKAGA